MKYLLLIIFQGNQFEQDKARCVQVHFRDGRIDPNIDSIDTKVSIGVGSVLVR